ncbi:MAG: 4-(cytidine 5'-diphospho)-2-C-methyl-D-erythritol kinase [Actinomycetota bacterium]|nr:4-(cytidine 5'-diphospho)-2-C-methyl-D-erythritol kinase [Actinomycetota bacterium]
MSTPQTITAPAKLTLELRVTGVRDDGYHLIDAEMVTLQWADTLTIAAGGHGLTADGPFAAGVPLDDTNLVAQALRLAGREAAVHLHKSIPHGGGLGGGSSDAAAVLRWAGYTDIAGSAHLGADVPFCLVGGRARVRGIGDDIQPLPAQAIDITLVIPPFSVSTPAVYRAWDELGGPRGVENDLEPAALVVEPRLVRWRDRIHEATGAQPTLAGSGGTWFLRGHHHLAEALPEAMVVQTRTDRQQHAAGGR